VPKLKPRKISPIGEKFMSKLVKSTHYSFRAKLTSTGLFMDDNWPYKRFHHFIRDGLPLPDGEKLDSPLRLFSCRAKTYDLYQDWVVSEKIAAVLREHAGQHINLWPINIDNNLEKLEANYPPPPRHRIPLTQPYYFLQVPVVECCLYTYGEAMPTNDRWKESVRQLNKGLQEKGVGPEYMKTLTETAIPITSITLDQDKIKDLPIFRPKEINNHVFCTDTVMRALKKAKVYGMDIEPHEYTLERIRSVKNSNRGILLKDYNMPVV
jgi:hypothetical protein